MFVKHLTAPRNRCTPPPLATSSDIQLRDPGLANSNSDVGSDLWSWTRIDIMEEEDLGVSVDASEVDETFDAATAVVASIAGGGEVSTDTKLAFYGLYKQATSGPCTDFRPSFFDRKARSKWAAWKNLGDLPNDQAKVQYIALLQATLPQWHAVGSSNGGQAAGPVVSTLAGHIQEDVNGPAMDSLQIRASEGDLSAVTRLLDAGADVNGRDEQGCCALHWAADRGCLEVVDALLSRGGDIHARDADGQTPLHYAAMCSHEQVFWRLMEAGADAAVQDSSGTTALDLAPNAWKTGLETGVT